MTKSWFGDWLDIEVIKKKKKEKEKKNEDNDGNNIFNTNKPNTNSTRLL